MSFVQVKSIEEAVTTTGRRDTGTTPCWSWADIEGLLGAEWEIGGPATPAHVIREVVAGK